MAARSLVDPERYLGTITRVEAGRVQANMPLATALPERRSLTRGVVGDFVFVDCELVKLLGRITDIGIPDPERLSIEPRLGETPQTNPVGHISLFGSVDLRQNKIIRGLQVHPHVGDAVYLADPSLLGDLMTDAASTASKLTVELGELDAGGSVKLHLQPERIFGRHCGVLGATGGGKSWTVAALVAQMKAIGGKAILFDPTGEFSDLPYFSAHYAFDTKEDRTALVHFPYRQMTEEDLFALFRPSGQSQGPKLREAIRSQKLVQALNGKSDTVKIHDSRIVVKIRQGRAQFYEALQLHAAQVHSPLCDFDIGNLAEQITAECVQSTLRAPGGAGKWGDADAQTGSYCETLIARIQMLVRSAELQCLFGSSGASLVDVLNKFLASEEHDIIRISFKNVAFEHNTREILMNVLGRFALMKARTEAFRERPIVLMLDEAHQFLGKVVGDEYASAHMDAFGLIAKEGRKYGLTCVLATQRPRDIPTDVLSQLGTFIVHRLTNDEDRHAIERACGDLDRDAAKFIPILGPGEAIIIGPDLPAPVPIKIAKQLVGPNSQGPDYDKYWRARRAKHGTAGKG